MRSQAPRIRGLGANRTIKHSPTRIRIVSVKTLQPMTDPQIVQFAFTVDDPELDNEERNAIAMQLLSQLRQIDEVESVERTEAVNPEVGSRAALETLIGFLTVEISRENLQKVLGWLHNRVTPKPLKIVVGEVTIEVQSSEDLAKAEQTVINILREMK